MRRAECNLGNVQWRMPSKVQGVEKEGEQFRVQTSAGQNDWAWFSLW